MSKLWIVMIEQFRGKRKPERRQWTAYMIGASRRAVLPRAEACAAKNETLLLAVNGIVDPNDLRALCDCPEEEINHFVDRYYARIERIVE